MLLAFTSARPSTNPCVLNVKGVGSYTFSSKEEKKRVVLALKAGLSLGQALRCWDKEVFEELVPPQKKKEEKNRKDQKNYLQETMESTVPKSFEEEQVLYWLKSPRRLQTSIKLQVVGYPGNAEEKSKAKYISDKGMYYLDGKWKKPHASLTRLMELFKTIKIKDLAKIFNLYEELTSHNIHIGGGGLRVQLLVDMACEDKFARLPSWVKAVLFRKYLAEVNYDFSWLGDVNPQVFIPCAKAWKWDTTLPKGIAYRVGLMEVKQRVLASIAWKKCCKDKTAFWEVFKDLLDTGCSYEDFQVYGESQGKKLKSMASILTGLPYGVLYSSGLELNLCQEVWENLKNPTGTCAMLFGFKGKATVKAYLNSGPNQIKWVRAFATNHDFCVSEGFNVVPFTEDYAQKILSLPYVIEFDDNVVKLLSHLQMSTVLKLLTQQQFKYRGEMHPLNPNHIRDCGYMWKNLQPRPNLGRVRCWFSLHELLSEEFVKQQPDEPIPFLKGWEKAHNLQHDGWKLVLPTNTSELKLWGKLHRCCIGGYGPKVKAGECQVFSVWEGLDMTHLVEVSSNGEVLQFNSPGNLAANEAVKKSVIDKLRKLRLVSI